MAVGLLDKAQVSELFLVVALTMALTPGLAELGQRLGKAFEKSDVKVRRRSPGDAQLHAMLMYAACCCTSVRRDILRC